MSKDLIKNAEQESGEGRKLSDYQMKKILVEYNKKLIIPKKKKISNFCYVQLA